MLICTSCWLLAAIQLATLAGHLSPDLVLRLSAAENLPPDRLVVVLYPQNSDGSPGSYFGDQSIRTVFADDPSAHHEIHNEPLDVSSPDGGAGSPLQREYLTHKCAGRRVDVVIGGLSSEAAGRLDPDLVVLDVSMPILDGFGVARRLTAQACRAKLVFRTVHQDDDLMRMAMEVGGNGYVVKPRLASDLVVALRDVLAGRRFVSKP